MSTLPVYKIKPENFRFLVSESDSESEFDKLLKENWQNAIKNDVFRYKLDISNWKILEGRYMFLAQLNINRAINRRLAENITSMNQPTDPNKFNFTKIPDKEIYFDIEDGTGNNIIAVNISPLEWGNCLFIPERFHKLPQKMTEYSLTKAIELLLLSTSPNLRIVFNGLCAFASVNHLHWHLYYTKHRFLLEKIELTEFVSPVYILENFPSKGFCIQLSSIPNCDIKKLTTKTFSLVQYFQEIQMPHNVFITRAKKNIDVNIFDDVRVYIWARKPSYGTKDTSAFNPAVCELFGHLCVKTLETYESLSEEYVSNLLYDTTNHTFDSVRTDVKLILTKICDENQ